ncbi:hypothetical protein, partial [Marinobacterium sp. xm-d-509]|uniref:hypothetical protein n=1 Tax=Marinobacterium sp. xm-d-509 TaxID=2497739 RepID=UPI00352DD322
IDIRKIDAIHCRRGRLGVGWHFLILVSGDIQLGRDIETCGSHSRGIDDLSVSIGVVGGVDEDGTRTNTRNPEQLEALTDLICFLSD